MCTYLSRRNIGSSTFIFKYCQTIELAENKNSDTKIKSGENNISGSEDCSLSSARKESRLENIKNPLSMDRHAAWSRVESNIHLETGLPIRPHQPRGPLPRRLASRQGSLRGYHYAQARFLRVAHLHCVAPSTTAMFAKTLQLMATPEQQAKWILPVQQRRINGPFIQTELGHGSFVPGARKYSDIGPLTDSFVLDPPTISTSRTKFWLGSLAFCYPRGCHSAACYPGGRP